MDEAEVVELVTYIARHPTAGEVMVGTGGARKLRWRRPGTGKSGGYRVITYYAGTDAPVYLMNVYTKGDRANLSDAERNALRSVTSAIAAHRERRSR